MTQAKVYSRAAKRRAKKAMPGLAETPKRKARGRERMAQIKADPDAERTVLQARARQCGVEPQDITEMRNAALSEPAGRAIYAMRKGDAAKRLWDAYTGCTAAEATYHKRYLGQGVHAKTAKIEMTPERVETRDDDRPDLRDEDQRARDACNNWMKWQGLIGHLDVEDRKALFDVAYGRVEPMDAGLVTAHGTRFVLAVERLADVIEARK